MHETYLHEFLAQIRVDIEPIVTAIGPVGDALYLPFRIVGGSIARCELISPVVCGVDSAVLFPDEVFVHDGRFVVRDADGDILFSYQGTSQAPEGTYDRALDGTMPGPIPIRMCVQLKSTNVAWRRHNRGSLMGIGSFDAASGHVRAALHALL